MRLPVAKDHCHVDDQPGQDRDEPGPATAVAAPDPGRNHGTAVGAAARIVLLAAAGWTNTTIARHVGVCVDTVRKWRHRWWVQPGTASLGDAKRSGRPPSFTPVQVAEVKA